jgi:hypothetical protein
MHAKMFTRAQYVKYLVVYWLLYIRLRNIELTQAQKNARELKSSTLQNK